MLIKKKKKEEKGENCECSINSQNLMHIMLLSSVFQFKQSLLKVNTSKKFQAFIYKNTIIKVYLVE